MADDSRDYTDNADPLPPPDDNREENEAATKNYGDDAPGEDEHKDDQPEGATFDASDIEEDNESEKIETEELQSNATDQPQQQQNTDYLVLLNSDHDQQAENNRLNAQLQQVRTRHRAQARDLQQQNAELHQQKTRLQHELKLQYGANFQRTQWNAEHRAALAKEQARSARRVVGMHHYQERGDALEQEMKEYQQRAEDYQELALGLEERMARTMEDLLRADDRIRELDRQLHRKRSEESTSTSDVLFWGLLLAYFVIFLLVIHGTAQEAERGCMIWLGALMSAVVLVLTVFVSWYIEQYCGPR